MLTVRVAEPADVPGILNFIRELAAYEREPDAVLATEEDLLRDGFGAAKVFDCLMAEWDGETAGFALYFHNYSTWRGHAGIHLEDIYVTPAMRGHGIGRALIQAVARIAAEEGCPRLQWDVLAWNAPAIGFYEKMGAAMQTEWRTMRVSDGALTTLAGIETA
jgi:GNAT superfamily N-acetyltransferase